jgi:hypothetical protein
VRNDHGTLLDRPEDLAPDPPSTARTRVNGLSMAMLALLMAGTSGAVASWVSPWLVPPYLILMAWLLFPSTSRSLGDLDDADRDPSNPLRPAQPGEDFDDLDNPADCSESDASSAPSKGRRGKGRVKKARPLPEPVEATWVQVAPGKFVRVEAAEAENPAGPHTPLGVPVEVPVTSRPSEGDEGEALSQEPDPVAVDEPANGQDGDPTGEVESDSPTAHRAVDGADVALEGVDEWGETGEGADPTETTVDETDFDDAGPFDDDPPHDLDPSEYDADSTETEAEPDDWSGSTRRSGRLAPWFASRVGHPPRAFDRKASPRRLVRSHGPTRKPPDPRRLTRRGVRRPRQITRPFPPRSPPRATLLAGANGA